MNQGNNSTNRLGWQNQRGTSSGGGGGITSLPVGNFVFVNTLGNDATGLREDQSKPFLTLNEAKNSAISGDTIFVFGGTFNEVNTLHKEGVKWHFIGKPTLNLSASFVWSDSGLQTNINISGDAIINHIGIGSVLLVTNNSTTVNFSVDSITARGQHALYLQAGSGNINIENDLTITLINRCIGFRGNASYTINVRDILCNATVNRSSNAIQVGNQLPIYTGSSIVNARNIKNGQNTEGFVIVSENAPITGDLTINTSGIIEVLIPTNNSTRDSALAVYGGIVTINGNIKGLNGRCIQFLNPDNKILNFNGNAINTGVKPCVDLGGSNWEIKLNGKFESSNVNVINIGSAGKSTIKGEIKSSYIGAGVNYGLFLGTTALTTILENLKIISDNNGTPFGIGSTVSKDIKINNIVVSNVDTDTNINILISGTSYVFDNNVE